jgi:hypothetical protein
VTVCRWVQTFTAMCRRVMSGVMTALAVVGAEAEEWASGSGRLLVEFLAAGPDSIEPKLHDWFAVCRESATVVSARVATCRPIRSEQRMSNTRKAHIACHHVLSSAVTDPFVLPGWWAILGLNQ